MATLRNSVYYRQKSSSGALRIVQPMLVQSRFTEVFRNPSPRTENQVLWHGEYSVVIPTLGMIVPNWFLIVPAVHTFNFAQQPFAARAELPSLVASICETVAGQDEELLIFEHGATHAGSSVGCGLDHAHLHVVVASAAFVGTVWAAMLNELQSEPREASLDGLYDAIEPDCSYYAAWHQGRRIVDQPAGTEVSQRFRRIIAAAADMPECWNYRKFPFHQNVEKTVSSVRHQRYSFA